VTNLRRSWFVYVTWIIVGVAVGFALARYGSVGMLSAFLHKLPGCF
jgi:hypothetical protein